MKIVKFCLLPVLVVFLLGGLAGWYFLKDMPTEWNVDVSVVIDAPVEEIHPWVEDLHRWPEWNAFGEQYPDTSYEFEGAEKGVGAVMTTSSSGSHMRLTITASEPQRGVWFDEVLEHKVPSKGVILYEEGDGGTTVRWQDHGSFGDSFFLRPFNYFLQEGLSEGFQANLEMLKAAVER